MLPSQAVILAVPVPVPSIIKTTSLFRLQPPLSTISWTILVAEAVCQSVPPPVILIPVEAVVKVLPEIF